MEVLKIEDPYTNPYHHSSGHLGTHHQGAGPGGDVCGGDSVCGPGEDVLLLGGGPDIPASHPQQVPEDIQPGPQLLSDWLRQH